MLNVMVPEDGIATATGALSGCFTLADIYDIETDGGAPFRSRMSFNRWRARNTYETGFKKHINHFGDRHIPMQVKYPELRPDPVVIRLQVPEPVISSATGGARAYAVVIA